MDNKLPNVKDCIAKVESCGYKLCGQHRMSYYFRATGPRPAHVMELYFNLGELRHAFKFGF